MQSCFKSRHFNNAGLYGYKPFYIASRKCVQVLANNHSVYLVKLNVRKKNISLLYDLINMY